MALTVEIPEILDAHFRAKADELHTAIPGKVVAYYPATQTVDVKPSVKRVSYDEGGTRNDDAYPVLPHVPVCWPGGGGFFVSFPLAPGDHVLVVFSEAATGDWRLSGNESSPSETARHGLNGAFAIPGARTDAQALADASSTNVVIGQDGTNIQISINGSAISLGKGASDFVALKTPTDANFATIVAAITAGIAAAVPTDGGKAALTAVKGALVFPTVAATLVKAK
jgi:hypothetical protein